MPGSTIGIIKVGSELPHQVFSLSPSLTRTHTQGYQICFSSMHIYIYFKTVPIYWSLTFLQSLIGHFDLDPNRVFDIVSHSLVHFFDFWFSVYLLPFICYFFKEVHCASFKIILMPFYQVLECFELQPENSVFVELIPIFPKVETLRSYDKLTLIILLLLIYELLKFLMMLWFSAVSCFTNPWVQIPILSAHWSELASASWAL